MTHQFDLVTRQALFKRLRHEGKTCSACGKPVTAENGWECCNNLDPQSLLSTRRIYHFECAPAIGKML
ncbi:MAG: hypothetical protein JWN23_1560 [Rhodocyclales bacterium]|nr:hypothetical protein [Rhodocyclales bacterium]